MRAKILSIIILLLLVIVFTVQNAEPLLIELWFWNFSISKALLIFLVLAVGVILGLIAGSLAPRKKSSPLPPGPPSQLL